MNWRASTTPEGRRAGVFSDESGRDDRDVQVGGVVEARCNGLGITAKGVNWGGRMDHLWKRSEAGEARRLYVVLVSTDPSATPFICGLHGFRNSPSTNYL